MAGPRTGPAEYRLSALELASGWVLGLEDELPGFSAAPADETPLGALERAVLPSLRRPPCLVSFSGGRDSSAVLAVAVRAARREGLPLPVPATHRFPHASGTEEGEWQERVVRELGLDDWLRLEWDDELDIIGPIAARMLRRHGVLWPFNIHFLIPLLEAASGGSLLTGVGGDDLFIPSRLAPADAVLTGQRRPTRRDLLKVAYAVSPGIVRRAAMRRRDPDPTPSRWLRDGARRAFKDTQIALFATEPVRFNARLGWWLQRRHFQMFFAHTRVLAAEVDVDISHPLLDPIFLAALGQSARQLRVADRDYAMRLLFGGVLSEEICARPTKATFVQPFWNRHSRAFVARWSGEGIDRELVDLEALRAEWATEAPNARTFLLLQAAWLLEQENGSTRDELEQAGSRLGDRAPAARPAKLPAG